MRIGILCGERPGEINAIRDASLCLAEALRAAGHSVEVLAEPADLTRYDLALVQYNPFLYGRWGFAPGLVVELWRLRLRRHRPRLAIVVHEPFVPMTGWRWTLMGLWQRAQLAAACAACDLVFVTIEAWAKAISWMRPRRPTVHLPVGSNLPYRREAASSERARLGADERTIVIATFGHRNGGRSPEHVSAAIAAIVAAGARPMLVALGADGGLPDLPESIPTDVPGRLSGEALSARVAAADIFLAPFLAGLSTRRTSTMVALQHGVAVIGTDGRMTDSVLRNARGLRLVPVERVDEFAAAAADLASNPEKREAIGRAGRALYEERFDWPVIAARLLAAVEQDT